MVLLFLAFYGMFGLLAIDWLSDRAGEAWVRTHRHEMKHPDPDMLEGEQSQKIVALAKAERDAYRNKGRVLCQFVGTATMVAIGWLIWYLFG